MHAAVVRSLREHAFLHLGVGPPVSPRFPPCILLVSPHYPRVGWEKVILRIEEKIFFLGMRIEDLGSNTWVCIQNYSF